MNTNNILTLKKIYEHDEELFMNTCSSIMKLEMYEFEKNVENKREDKYKLNDLYEHLRNDQESLEIVYEELTKGTEVTINSFKREKFEYNEKILEILVQNKFNSSQEELGKSLPETYVYTLDTVMLEKNEENIYSINKQKEYIYYLLEPCNLNSFFLLLDDIIKKNGKFAVIGVLSPKIVKKAKEEITQSYVLISQLETLNQISFKYNIINDLIIPYSLFDILWCSSFNINYDSGKNNLIDMFEELKKKDKRLDSHYDELKVLLGLN